MKKPSFFLFVITLLLAGFFVLVPSAKADSPAPAINFAPNFWFDSQEKYYPANPLDFYFENGQEISGEIAVKKYNQLSLQARLENLTVFYHIQDYGNQWVYQYWFFYVFNDSLGKIKNKHFGDWEAIFVFIDKDSGKVLKVIGTAHQRKIFDTEILEPENEHIWTYVGSGSHANCIDEKGDGYCNFTRWKVFEKWDKDGYRIFYNNYKLQEITLDFISNFKGAITLEKSIELGINLFDIFEITKKEFYLSIGGSPSIYAWEQSNYYNPEEIRPVSSSIAEKFNQTKNKITGFFNDLIAQANDFLGKINPFDQGSGLSVSTGVVFNKPEASEEFNSESGALEQGLPLKITSPAESKGVSEMATLDLPSESEPNNKEPNQTPQFPEAPEIETPETQESSQVPIITPPIFAGNIGTPESPESETQVQAESAPASTTTSLLLPKIISPENRALFGQQDDFSTSTDGFQVNLIGTSTPSYSILVFINSTSTEPNYSTTTSAQGDWEQIITLQEGENIIRVKARDDNNNESEETSLTVTVDTISPSAITDLLASPGAQRGAIDLFWTAPGDNQSTSTTSQYIIRYATSSEITAGNWAAAIDVFDEPSPAPASAIESFSVSNLIPGQTYYWAIKSQDPAGNISGISNCASSTPQAQADNLVISEIAVRGPNGAKDEFIELYNPTDSPINLSGWSLQYAAGHSTTTWSYKYFNISGQSSNDLPDFDLEPGKYYLLTSATSSVFYSYSMLPDLTAITTANSPTYLGLGDSGKIRLLDDQEKIIDLVAWGGAALGAEQSPVDVSGFSWGSIERKALVGSSAELLAVLGSHYYLGNGYDTNNNSHDFVLQAEPNPQNSSALWSNPRLVSTLVRKGASLSSIVLDKSENPIVVYYEFPLHGTGPERILFTQFDSLAWSMPITLSCLSPGNCSCSHGTPDGCLWAKTDSPVIVKDQSGILHVFFSAKTSLASSDKADIYWTRFETGAWSEPENLSLATTTDSLNPAALVDSQNQIHLSWQEQALNGLWEIYYSNLSFNGSVWLKSDPVNISQSQKLISYNPSLVANQSNELYLFWFEKSLDAQDANTGIYYNQLIDGLSWASSTQIFKTQGSGINPPDRFSLAIDEQNQLHLAWSEKNNAAQTHIFYSQTKQGVWQEPVELFEDLIFVYQPILVLKDDQSYIFGSGQKTSSDPLNIYFTYFDSQAGTWTVPLNLNQDQDSSFYPIQALWGQTKGVLYLFWWDNSSGLKAYVSQMKI